MKLIFYCVKGVNKDNVIRSYINPQQIVSIEEYTMPNDYDDYAEPYHRFKMSDGTIIEGIFWWIEDDIVRWDDKHGLLKPEDIDEKGVPIDRHGLLKHLKKDEDN